ncbi:MAG TPA: MFS transporter [Trebonia sp.]|nr:MFS transporter [Trebonia sp.]
MIDARQRNVALLVAGCYFMEMLDGTIVTTASPAIGRALHAPATEIGLLVTAYLLTLAVLIPLSGWLARRFGNRVIFLSAIAIFTLASIGCASSTSVGELVGMRVLQGVGGAMMVPVGRTMVVSTAAKKDLLRVTSYVVWPGLIAPVLAPLAGGLLTTYASWHWIFLINAPLGVVAFVIAWRLVANTESAVPPPLDWAGVLLTCLGLGGLTYFAHLVSLSATPLAQTVVLGVASAALLTGAVRHLRRAAHPLLNIRTLSIETFRVSQFGGSLYWLVVGAGPFLLPLLWQTQFGWSPVKSGAVVLFIFAGNVGIKPATTPLINRFGFRTLLIVSTVIMAATMVGLAFTTAATPLAVIGVLALISGIVRSTALTVYNTVGFADMPADQMRDANTLLATTTQLANGLSVAFATVALRIGGLLPGAGTHASMPYAFAFCLLAVVSLVAAGEAMWLRRDAGDAVRTTRPARATAGERG